MPFNGSVAINASEVFGVLNLKVIARQELTPLSDYCTSDVVGYNKKQKEFLISIECEYSGVDDVDFSALDDFNLIIKTNNIVEAYEACEWEKIETVFENDDIKKKYLTIRSPKKYSWEEEENG